LANSRKTAYWRFDQGKEIEMNVIDLEPKYYDTYFNCLEDWSEEIKEAGNHKACWYHRYKEKGLKVKIALDEKGTAIGMIQYLPIQEAFLIRCDFNLSTTASLPGAGLCFDLPKTNTFSVTC
jgi:hypothetical protein